MNEHTHAILIIIVMGIATFATRILPVLIFDRSDNIPPYIQYLGKTIPYTAMGLLIVYCLRDVSIVEAPRMMPELIALAIVSASYLWKRNVILSVTVGTIAYMLMVQVIF